MTIEPHAGPAEPVDEHPAWCDPVSCSVRPIVGGTHQSASATITTPRRITELWIERSTGGEHTIVVVESREPHEEEALGVFVFRLPEALEFRARLDELLTAAEASQ